MPTATLKFTPHSDGNFDYELSHSTPEVDERVKKDNVLLYAHGDMIVFTTDSGNFWTVWDREAGDVKLRSPFKNDRPTLDTPNLPSPPYKASDKVDTALSEDTRRELRQKQGFVAKYRYSITVKTKNGTFTDNRVGTYDC